MRDLRQIVHVIIIQDLHQIAGDHLDFQDLLLALDHQVRCEVLAGHDRQDHEAEVALEEVADADKFQTISY